MQFKPMKTMTRILKFAASAADNIRRSVLGCIMQVAVP
jgi:hypothetical protein